MKVSQDEFKLHFLDALSQAANAMGLESSLDSKIELHLFGTTDCSVEEAVSRLFLSDDIFYSCIDVSVPPKRGPGVFFVRASGHPPCGWHKTYHAKTTGPFNIMTPA